MVREDTNQGVRTRTSAYVAEEENKLVRSLWSFPIKPRYPIKLINHGWLYNRRTALNYYIS
jgi:hypothetical protein